MIRTITIESTRGAAVFKDMRRRDLLTTAALGTALAFLPTGLRRALVFAADACNEHAARLVARALERARELGKPVAVFVVPEDTAVRETHAALLATLIDLGPDRAVAALAFVEVVCAPLATVRCVAPNAPNEPKDAVPLMLSIDPETYAVTQLPAPARETVAECPLRDGRVDERCERRAIRALCGRLVRPLHRAIVGPDFARLVERNAAALGPERAAQVRAAAVNGGATLSTTAVDDGALLLFATARATGDAAARGHVIERLAAASRARLRDHPPPGARWARFDGCIQYAHQNDDDLSGGFACGLGGTPFLAARFLHFLTAIDRST